MEKSVTEGTSLRPWKTSNPFPSKSLVLPLDVVDNDAEVESFPLAAHLAEFFRRHHHLSVAPEVAMAVAELVQGPDVVGMDWIDLQNLVPE